MKKQVKKIGGGTLVISFTMEERKIYGIKEGDIIEFENLIVLSKIIKKEK